MPSLTSPTHALLVGLAAVAAVTVFLTVFDEGGTIPTEPASAAPTASPVTNNETADASSFGNTGLWRAASTPAANTPPRPDVPDATAVSLNESALTSLAIGDELLLSLADGRTEMFRIESQKTRVPTALASYRGSFVGQGPSSYGVITVGEALVLGTFFTPQGAFELKGNKSHGWVYPAKPGFEHADDGSDIVPIGAPRPQPKKPPMNGPRGINP